MIKTECNITLFRDANETLDRIYCTLGDSKSKTPWNAWYRYPWDDISEKATKSCNMICTLNPDIRVDFDVHDRKVCNKKLLQLLVDLKNKDILTHIILVYEYGEKGKEHGKLHYHFICKVSDRQAFEKAILKVFNRRSQLSHRTLQTKLVKTCEDRSRYLKYMKKETQNKIKTLIAF